MVAAKMSEYFGADKMNVAALGNVVKQLHVHHIARFELDAAWPAPVWGKVAATEYSETMLEALCTDLRRVFEGRLAFS